MLDPAEVSVSESAIPTNEPSRLPSRLCPLKVAPVVASKPGAARYGKSFSPNQKRHDVAAAMPSALREVSEGKYKAAIALPD